MKHRKRQQSLDRLRSRQEAYDQFIAGVGSELRKAYHRPGSTNPHKGHAIKGKNR